MYGCVGCVGVGLVVGRVCRVREWVWDVHGRVWV